MIEWCCVQFMWYYNRDDTRGERIAIERTSIGSIYFKLQFRSIDKDKEQLLGISDIPITITSEFGILFCPWCGSDLNEYYHSYMDKLVK